MIELNIEAFSNLWYSLLQTTPHGYASRYLIIESMSEWIKENNISLKFKYEIDYSIGSKGERSLYTEKDIDYKNLEIYIHGGDRLTMFTIEFESQEDYNLFKLTWG